jgi:hypothetical protein
MHHWYWAFTVEDSAAAPSMKPVRYLEFRLARRPQAVLACLAVTVEAGRHG